MTYWKTATLEVWTGLFVLFAFAGAASAGDTNTESELRALHVQNEALQIQLQKQQQTIEALSREVREIRQTSEQRDAEVDQLKSDKEDDKAATPGFSANKLQITGEGAAGLFESGSQGQYPNAEFRVDEAKLFFDAPVWGDVYAFAEVNLAAYESDNVNLNLGELYVDFENVSQLWGRERQLNVRAGRLDIPFGEEYLRRDAIDNPLISRSLSDLWGVDEGIELYGAFGKFSYAAAVQNGGVPTSRDFDADKAVAGRLSYDPLRWLHVSVSGMRTGNLDSQQDFFSELWFGSWWLKPVSPNTTKFHANLFEGDFTIRLPRGHISAFGGCVLYDDNAPGVDDGRDLYYYSVEAVQDLTRRLYAAARFSQIFAAQGFALVGNGNMNIYSAAPTTTGLWRLSLGLGYRWSRHLVVKAEYSFEQGHQLGGVTRNHENLFATEAAFGF